MTTVGYSQSLFPIFSVIIALCVIGGALVYYKKRPENMIKRPLKIIDRISLGKRSAILLVKAGTEEVLLGITPTGINTLAAIKNIDEKFSFTSDFKERIIEFPVLENKNRA